MYGTVDQVVTLQEVSSVLAHDLLAQAESPGYKCGYRSVALYVGFDGSHARLGGSAALLFVDGRVVYTDSLSRGLPFPLFGK